MTELRFLTAGESHGPSLTGIVEGMPAGLEIDEDYIAHQLARRQHGYGRGGRMKIEKDRAIILSGVANGKTTGGPITLRIDNRDWENWKNRKMAPITVPRPGHADWVGGVKYGHDDMRLVLERSSARETTTRVACGSVARRLLEEFGMKIFSHIIQIGRVRAESAITGDAEQFSRVDESPVRCIDPDGESRMINHIDEARKKGDTLGGVFEVVVTGMVPGMGSYVHWDRKLDGRLAQAILSVNAIKGVEIGGGFNTAALFGTEAHDQFYADDGRVVRGSNRAGGLEGGVSNGEPLLVRGAMKPISTTIKTQHSVDLASGQSSPTKYQRSDVCAVPAAGVIGEAMVALVVADAFIDKFGGDSVREIRRNLEGYLYDSRRWFELAESSNR